MKKSSVSVLFGCLATVRLIADPIPGLYNTGVTNGGALLPSGSIDPHYRLVQSADAAFPGPNAIVLNDTGFPIPPWMANGPTSKWLAPQASQAVGNQPGDYTYRITFDLSTLDHFTAVITGRWSSDNAGAAILINGVETGITYDGNFGAFSPVFTISSGFLEGTNTLDFVVNNAPGPGINPTGFRAEVSGTADPLPPPGTPPSITQNPVSQTNGVGESAIFSVRARGSRPLTYQWRFNSEPILNATNSSLTLNLLTPAHTGQYDVVVTNPSDSATSLPAMLKVVVLSPAQLTYEPLGPSSRRTGLAISEIMYHPKDRADNRNLEFVEIYNSNPFAENISGYCFSGSFDYTLPPNTIIAGNGFLVIAPMPGDIEAEYGITGVLGGYTNNLPNNAGLVRLRKPSGALVLEVPYQDGPPWPPAADGAGHSLVLAKASFGERDPQAWAASAYIGGSPGAADPIPGGPLENVMINEILANTDAPLLDFIELYNYSPAEADLSGCFVTDERNTNIFRIPNGTILSPGGFIAFDQSQLGFALSASGETVYFINSNATRVIDAIRFGGQATGVSYGRFPDGAPSFHELSARTSGLANAPLLIQPIVINEIMYNPISGSNDDEYVELYNRSSAAIDVGGWRFLDGISYTIPNGVMISPNGYLVIAANASRLLTNYPGLSSANVLGNFTGNLSNDGERLALAKPEVVVETNASLTVVTNTFYVVMDEVTYRDGGRWGHAADGGGSSLELIDPHSDNRLPSNWAESDETGKAPWTTIQQSGIADNGHPSTPTSDQLQVFLQGAGEALVDDVEVFLTGSTNRILNSTFTSGTNGWTAQGTHRLSGWAPATGALYLKATERGDHVANRVRTPFTQGIPANANVTIRARARWLSGHPEILLRLRGGFLEAAAKLQVPANLGTPGAENSVFRVNVGPTISGVSHRPILPQPGEVIRVTSRVHDPDLLASVILHYRIDPAPWSPSSASSIMNDAGVDGDFMAGDGIYTGLIPAQTSGKLVGFYVEATDHASISLASRFPADAPARECLVRVGDPLFANAFGTYRFWMTQASHDFWGAREKMSNEGVDCTFIYGRNRIVYNIGGHYSGSSYTAPIYTTPTGALCGYDLTFPDDDLMLGEDHLTLDWPIRDSTNQREQLMYWFLEQFGLPNMYRRYINLFVNGVKRGAIYDDVQQPGGDTIEQWFADDAEGNLYKTDCWNEFDDAGNRVDPCILNSLENFTTTGGAKKVARYRWNWRPRATHGTANDFSDLFALIDAANTNNQGGVYQSAVEGVVDMDHWMRTFCMNDLASFWDAFGNPNAKNTYLYKPENSGWKLFCWDFDVGLGVFNDPVNDPLFPSNVDPVVQRMYNFPAFIRAYWRAMQEAMNGFFQVGPGTAIDFILDSKYAAFQANGIALDSPDPIKTWITQRRNFILSQMTAATNAPFNLSGTNYIATNRNLVAISGTAPVRVQTVLVNGTAYGLTWTTLTNWSITLAVSAGTNALRIDALDPAGHTNGTRTMTVEYTGLDENPQDRLVINEIMYNPLTPEASYIEIYNRSQTYSFDISNWRMNGVDFTFGGKIITNGQYVVIAKNRQAFGAAYGWHIPALGPFGGQLDDGGETLSLIRPDAFGEASMIDQVTYDDDPPWPAAPDGSGPALQLIDAAQDNNRVSNWSDGSGWKFFSFTGSSGASGSRLSLFLTNFAADVFIDDIAMVEGSAAGAGTNLILNGGFESASLAPWNKSGLATNSAIENTVARTGNQSLHLVYATGGAALTHFYQDLTNVIASGVKPNTVYTISFWYMAGTNSHLFQTRINSTFRTATDVRPIGFTPGAPNNIARALPPYPSLWLSEVQPENVTGPTDRAGDRDPWVEIYFSGLNDLPLDGYYLSGNYANLRQWAFPGSTAVHPSEFKLVWADGEPAESSGTELHTSFRLNPTNGIVALSREVDGAAQIIDYINYRNVAADRSFGAFPDGQSSFRGNFYYPTPGGTNNPAGAPVPVFINEWMAANTRTLADPADGNFDDWFELYNASATPVNLGGFSLTDSQNPRKYVIPAGFTIPAHGYALFWADEEGNQNGSDRELHVNFRLGADGETLALFDPDRRLVDSIGFLRQRNDVSEGRFPDGAAALFSMTSPTPRAANVVTIAEVRVLSIEYDSAAGVTLTWSAQAGKTYRVEYKNDLADSSWTPVSGEVVAFFEIGSKTDDTIASVGQRFYRVVLLP
ncbi:MAG TPA: lamin tail domain-containing protein [Verrucomicrobiae bacterium]|nr:lamin tail domain-containing protein [Verrucomicrobiae bacterium]